MNQSAKLGYTRVMKPWRAALLILSLPWGCGGTGIVAKTPACVPRTCNDVKACGQYDDGCGNTLVCDERCECLEIGLRCGTVVRNGHTVDCGSCAPPALPSLDAAISSLEHYPEIADALGDGDSFLRQTLKAFIVAEEACRQKDWQACSQTVADLLKKQPRDSWPHQPQPMRPHSAHFGHQPFYYAMRIFDSLSHFMLENPGRTPSPEIGVTAVVVKRAFNKNNLADFVAEKSIDPAIGANNHQVVREAFAVFGSLIQFWTEGRYSMNLRIVELDESVAITKSSVVAWELPDLGVVGRVDASILEDTHLALLVYPSLLPDYADSDFIVGGNSLARTFCSDQWLLQKKKNLGFGPYTAIERRAYMPQWLQHEFMHFIFSRYQSFELEKTPHQWFDRATWPGDFVGTNESDYYHESLVKRIHPQGEPSLTQTLLTSF